MIPTRPKLELLCLGHRWQWRLVDKIGYGVIDKGVESGKDKAMRAGLKILKTFSLHNGTRCKNDA